MSAQLRHHRSRDLDGVCSNAAQGAWVSSSMADIPSASAAIRIFCAADAFISRAPLFMYAQAIAVGGRAAKQGLCAGKEKMIELYGMSSPNVLKITIMLHEAALPYQLHHVGVFEGDQFLPTFKALNPNSKVPVLVDHGGPAGASHTVFESGAILLYLAEKTAVGLASEPLARSRQMQWLMLQLTGIGPMFGQLTHFSRYAPEGNDYSLARYRSEVRRLLKVLDERLSDQEYLSDGYSIADMATVPWIRLASTMYPWLQADGEGRVLADYPSLGRWLQRVTARPAVRAGIEAGERFLPEDIAMFKKAGNDQFDRFFGRGKYLLA